MDLSSIIYPLPTDELLNQKEHFWHLTLPIEYREFIKKYNGIKPKNLSVNYNLKTEKITRFLCILDSIENTKDAILDIGVVYSPRLEGLVYSGEAYGVQVLPIAKLEKDNFLALDYKAGKASPKVVVWDGELSTEFNPVTYFVAENFKEFLQQIV